MATSGQLAFILHAMTGVPLGTVQFHGQSLRAGGLLSKGGRGRSASDMTTRDTAVWLVSLCTGVIAEAGPIVAPLVLDLKPSTPYLQQTLGLLDPRRRFLTQLGVAMPIFTSGDQAGTNRRTLSINFQTLGEFIEGCIDGYRREKIYIDALSEPYGHIDFSNGGEEVHLTFTVGYGPNISNRFIELAFLDQTRFLLDTPVGAPSAIELRPLHPKEPPKKPTAVTRITRLDLLAFKFLAQCLDDVPLRKLERTPGSE